MKFEEKNVNPKNKKTGDCVIRAIAEATGMKWEEVFDGLVELARKKYETPGMKRIYEKYLEQLGWQKQKMPKKLDGKRYKISEFFEEYKYKEAVIVSVANHLTCIRDNVLIDTWDCSRKSIGNYWIKKIK